MADNLLQKNTLHPWGVTCYTCITDLQDHSKIVILTKKIRVGKWTISLSFCFKRERDILQYFLDFNARFMQH